MPIPKMVKVQEAHPCLLRMSSHKSRKRERERERKEAKSMLLKDSLPISFAEGPSRL